MDTAQMATETATILATRCAEACAYAEAYGHNGRTVVIDGTLHSPSDRALPNGERVYQDGTPDDFEDWRERVDYFLSGLTVQCEDSDSQSDDPEYAWSFVWEDGCLFAYHPDHSDD